jgi:transcriptional regulator with XRE-family HTH domain
MIVLTCKTRDALLTETHNLGTQDVFYTEFGRRIRAARERAGLTQDALAARVSLSRTSVTNIERGRQKVLLHTFCDLAAALGVAPEAFLCDAVPPPSPET